MSKAPIFALLLSILIVFGTTPVWAAQLDARINPDSTESLIEVKYQRTVFIEYNEGGQVADQLRGQSWVVETTGSPSDPGVSDLMNKINQKLANDKSGARIADLNVEYSAHFNGRPLSASIDYKIVLSGTLTDYIIRERQGQSPALIDVGWRGITVQGPVVVNGVEINLPVSPIKENLPEIYSQLAGSEAEELLSMNIINAEGIKNQRLSNWHFLFDPTGINVDASQFGLSEEISGFVVSGYTMGESSIREGRQVEKEFDAQFTADKIYTVRSVESADNANIDVIGFANIDRLDDLEIFGVTPRPPEGFAQTSTGDFPVAIIYGMAAMAAAGGGAIFWLSSRQLKKEAKEGSTQRGIDPSRLRAYQTSVGSGGYQTVRGEAQLIDDSDYQKTRSVYDESKEEKPSEPQSTKGSMPKGWKPK